MLASFLIVVTLAAGSPRFSQALPIAKARFGTVCPAGIQAQWTELTPGVLAQVQRGRCRIQFSPAIRHYPFRWFCTVVVHEYGHLAGRSHSTNPRSVMFPFLRRVYPPCNLERRHK